MTVATLQANSAGSNRLSAWRVRAPTNASRSCWIALAIRRNRSPPSAGLTSHENEQAALSPAASPAQKIEAAA